MKHSWTESLEKLSELGFGLFGKLFGEDYVKPHEQVAFSGRFAILQYRHAFTLHQFQSLRTQNLVNADP